MSHNNSIIKLVREKAKIIFKGAKGSHDWEHTLRVLRLCEHIGPSECADIVVLLIAALLHDIGRSYQDVTNGKVCHAAKGAELAKPIIDGLDLTEEQKENIVHCIRSHRFRDSEAPRTIEAKVLYDADKLDAIGAVGVARAYLFAGELGAKLHSTEMNVEKADAYSKYDTGYREYKVKLCKIKNKILTQVGQRIAEDRHAFMKQFFERFLDEYDGKR